MFEKTEPNCAIITVLTNVRKHSNADKLQLATVLGEQVIVDLKAKDGDVVIYFDSNLCLSNEFLSNNNLYSVADMNKDTTKKGYFGKNGKVKAQSFRGEKSYGFVCPLSFLDFARPDVLCTSVNTEFNIFNGVPICKKYILPKQHSHQPTGTKQRKNNKYCTNMFHEHWDTAQFKRNLDKIPNPCHVYVEEKYHGTSGRSAYVLVKRDLNIVEKILKLLGVKIKEEEYEYLNGSRRVVLTKKKNYNPYYKGTVRDEVFNKLKPNLRKGEQLYYEIVGYDTNGGYIQKGFPYGCKQGEHKVILYRVTINTEDGKVYDMNREYVYKRAEELGLIAPHLFYSQYHGMQLVENVESFTNGNSTLSNDTIREGVVVWYLTPYGTWTCLKNKSFAFLEKESKLKDTEDYVDIEDEA